MSISINEALPHEAIIAANEAKGLSENDRQRIVSEAERQVAQHRDRELNRIEAEAAEKQAEADDAHDTLAEIEVEIDRLTKRAQQGGMTSAELAEAMEQIDRDERAALRRLEKAESALERIARDEADPYGAHVRMIQKYPSLRGQVSDPRG